MYTHPSFSNPAKYEGLGTRLVQLDLHSLEPSGHCHNLLTLFRHYIAKAFGFLIT